METKTTEQSKTVEMLERLGFTAAATEAKTIVARKRKLALAYEHYKYVRTEKVVAFNAALKQKTIQGKEPYNATWKMLEFVGIGTYPNIPPEEVLIAHEQAVNLKCFDSFEVAFIKDVKDPLLFGRVENCSDRFYIAGWDDDVKIEDLIGPNEG